MSKHVEIALNIIQHIENADNGRHVVDKFTIHIPKVQLLDNQSLTGVVKLCNYQSEYLDTSDSYL